MTNNKTTFTAGTQDTHLFPPQVVTNNVKQEQDWLKAPLCNCDGLWHIEGEDGTTRYLDDLINQQVVRALEEALETIRGSDVY